VAESKSLWSVALSVKPTGVKVWQAVMALYERNPDAFYQNDVNKLKDNVTLVVPSKEVMLSLTEAEALVRFQLLADQPQPKLDKLTLDNPSKPSVDLTNDASQAAPNLSMPDNTQESTEKSAQNLTTLNEEDETPVETSCLMHKCNPKGISVDDDRRFSNVGDVYVSAGVSTLRNYSANTRWGFSGDTSLNRMRGGNGFEVNLGYLWRDGIIFELGYQEANSELYRKEYSDNTSYNYGPNQYIRISHKLVSISPKILFSTDYGKQVSLYSGLGVGWIKDEAYYDRNIPSNPLLNTSDKGASHGGLYQILLGSKILLKDNFFVDLRIQNKHFLSRTFSSSGVLNGQLVKKYDTLNTVFSIGRAL